MPRGCFFDAAAALPPPSLTPVVEPPPRLPPFLLLLPRPEALRDPLPPLRRAAHAGIACMLDASVIPRKLAVMALADEVAASRRCVRSGSSRDFASGGLFFNDPLPFIEGRANLIGNASIFFYLKSD